MFCSPLLIGVQAALALAQSVHVVRVGSSGLTFTPSSLTASVGDQVEFHFDSPYHTVTRGRFDLPCAPSGDEGFNSGVVADTSSGPFTITVKDMEPIYFYCAEMGHCPAGMAGAINAPDDASAADYMAAARAATSDRDPPPEVYGGEFAPATTPGPSKVGSTTAETPAGERLSIVAIEVVILTTRGQAATWPSAGPTELAGYADGDASTSGTSVVVSEPMATDVENVTRSGSTVVAGTSTADVVTTPAAAISSGGAVVGGNGTDISPTEAGAVGPMSSVRAYTGTAGRDAWAAGSVLLAGSALVLVVL